MNRRDETSTMGRRDWIGRGLALCMASWFVVTVASGCGDDGGNTDGGLTGDWGTGDRLRTDYKPFKCMEPGKSCQPHDACAINPICGKDGYCWPERFQDCSDELDCTVDSCIGKGVCSHKAKAGFCALYVTDKSGKSSMKCVKQGESDPLDPCRRCDTAKSQTKWSSASGSSCNDGNACTKDDKCQDGTCKGTVYSCSDNLDCTSDTCDGKGACTNTLKSGTCKISGVCYKEKVTDSSGCTVCDPTKDPYAWTQVANVCKIGAKCYASGTSDKSGCGVCDPTTSSTSWSAATTKCFIDDTCYSSGDLDITGCAKCDPTLSTTAFSPLSGKCLIRSKCYSNGAPSPSGCGKCVAPNTYWTPLATATQTLNGFESGLGGYTVSAKVSGVGWEVSTKRAHSGSASLYYGSSTSGTYDNGAANLGSATSTAVSLSSGKKAALQLWLYMDTETASSFDVLTVSINGSVAWTKDTSTTMPAADYRSWVPVEIDLSSYAGSSVTITFTFDTKDSWANASEGIYIDDVALLTDCS